MQDKYEDKKFEDRAWREMQRRLDKEMPVAETHHRRLAWWWLSLLLLVLATAGLGWFLSAKKDSVPNPANLPAAGAEKPVVADDAFNPSKEIVSEKAIEQAASTDPRNLSLAPSSADPSTTNKPAAARRLPSKDPSLRSALSEGSEGSSRAEAARLTDSDRRLPDELPLPLQRPAALQQLPLLTTFLPDVSPSWQADQALAEAKTVLPQSSSLMPDHWGWRLGALTTDGWAPNGMDAGIFGEYRLGSGRWSLGFGLDYTFLHQDLAAQGRSGSVNESVAMPDSPSTGGNVNQDNDFSSEATATLTNLEVRRHSLRFPVDIAYQVSPRLCFSMGVNAQYTLAADAKLASGYSFSGNRQDTYFQRVISATSRGDFKKEVLTDWDLGMHGSMHYRPHRRVGIELQYNFGMLDQVPSDRLQLYNRYLGLGLRYYVR